jgi:hypothetical protein
MLDRTNVFSHTDLVAANPPWCPPLVELGGGIVAHLLAWQQQESDGTWWAWVSWVQQTSERVVHKIVLVRAGTLAPLEEPSAYADVPRRVHCADGTIRPFAAPESEPIQTP